MESHQEATGRAVYLRVVPLAGLEADPWINCVQHGILDDIRFVLDAGRWRAVMTLTYAGIDAIASTTVPSGQRPGRSYFIAWANQYIRFPGTVQVPGEDLYGARCAILHTYGTESALSKAAKCRLVIHGVGGSQLVREDRSQPDAIVVEVGALARAFIAGVEKYGDEMSRDDAKWQQVTNRLAEFNHTIPFSP